MVSGDSHCSGKYNRSSSVHFEMKVEFEDTGHSPITGSRKRGVFPNPLYTGTHHGNFARSLYVCVSVDRFMSMQ